jgi:hypothetical protein
MSGVGDGVAFLESHSSVTSLIRLIGLSAIMPLRSATALDHHRSKAPALAELFLGGSETDWG